MKKPQQRLAYHYYYIPTLLFVIAGIGVSLYLAQSHYRNFTDPAYASFCAISRSINCDTVAQSPWSVIGGLPVALWGLLGYLFYFLLLLPLAKENDLNFSLWRFLFFLGWLYSLASLFFSYISATKIHSFCILCIASNGISFALLFQSWLVCRRFNIFPFYSHFRSALSLFYSNFKIYFPLVFVFFLFLIAQLFMPHYWEFEAAEIPGNITKGVTENGHPWIGAEEPVLIIEEFSDYQCFQCLKMHFTLRKLIQEHPNKIRLVHRHYPMDHDFNPVVIPKPFHVGSGKMALLAIYAMTQGKFWEMNDALFQFGRTKMPFNTKYLAEKTGIPARELTVALSHPDIKKMLNHDILIGMKKRITATPTFVINDKVYTGFIPPEILDQAVRL